MKLSELIVLLEALREQHGDLPVVWESISHTWPPDPIVKKGTVVLNG